jgi:VanZ family protein
MDKLLHFGGYAVFAVLADWAMEGEPGSARGCIAVIFPFCVGAAIEIVQPLVGRTMSWADAGANTAGLVAGFVLAELVLRARRAAGAGRAADDV